MKCVQLIMELPGGVRWCGCEQPVQDAQGRTVSLQTCRKCCEKALDYLNTMCYNAQADTESTSGERRDPFNELEELEAGHCFSPHPQGGSHGAS